MRRMMYLALCAVWTVSMVAYMALVLGPTGVANAQGGGPGEVVATNLNNPRHMTWGADGALYVAESGKAGDSCINIAVSETMCYGLTGAITRIMISDTEGLSVTQERVVTGLPSTGGPGGVASSGPTDVAFMSEGTAATETMSILLGLGGTSTQREQCELAIDDAECAKFGTLVAMNGGTWEVAADLVAYEETEDPDGEGADSNPYGLLRAEGGHYAVDAGGNDLLWIDDAGDISTAYVFPTQTATIPPTTTIPIQSVPTAIIEAPDGSYYVSELNGFPHPYGASRVYRVAPSETPSVTIAYEGLTYVSDIALNPMDPSNPDDDILYAVEISTNAFDESAPGALMMVTAGSEPMTVTDQLTYPTGVEVGPDGWVYVANFGIFTEPGPQPEGTGGPPPAGQIIRINPDAPTAVTISSLETGGSQGWFGVGLGVVALASFAGVVLLRRRLQEL